MAGFDNDVVYANNADFSKAGAPGGSAANGLQTNGELWIGTTAPNVGGTHINVGAITSPMGSISVGYSSPNITLEVAGSSSITLTADDTNSLTGSAFNLFGQKAGVTPIMQTLISGGNFLFESNAWETPYVVDSNTSTGFKGTYSTIQSALDQAVTDGMTLTNPRKFIIRPASTAYTENLTIPQGAYFYADTNQSSPYPFVSIVGNHTLGTIGVMGSEGIVWTCSTGTLFTGGVFTVLLFNNSVFTNSGTGLIVDASSSSITIPAWSNCTFTTGRTDSGTVFSLNSCTSSGLGIYNCQMGTCGFAIDSGNIVFSQCTDIGEVNQVSDVSNGVIATDCSFSGDVNSNIYGLGSARLNKCVFANGTFSNFAVDLTGISSMVNCSMFPEGGPHDFINTSSGSASYSYSQLGNVLGGIRSATNVSGSSEVNYLGITNTSSARSVVINKGPADYQIYVVDESGGAATNNITVTGAGGALINGQSSYVITKNYGSALFHSDGTNWFVSAASNSTGGGFPWLDASGTFTAAKNTGYFLTAAATPTLPASPSQGDIVEFVVTTAATMTITANTGQVIVLDGATSAAAGTAVASTSGNAIRLVYRSSGTTWWATSSVGASWTIT